jgi:hypothetical protein
VALRWKPPVERRRDGTFRLHLRPPERELVRRLLTELRDVLTTGDPDDPRLRRLFPTAYAQDAELDAEYQRLMREDLVASRLDAIATVDAALDAPSLTEVDVVALMQSVNALRLVLGTMLDVDEEHDTGAVDPDDPLLAEHHLYDFLSYLLDATVRALAGD